MQNKDKKIIFDGILIIVLIGYYFLSNLTKIFIPCLFYELTSFYCPGCGVTRMINSFFKLEIYQAFRYNPLVFILLIIFIIVKILKIKIPNYIYYIIIIILIIYGILRNIPYFDYLKPVLIK